MSETLSLTAAELPSFLKEVSSLPEILGGRHPRYATLRQRFWGFVAARLFEHLQKSFRDRSHGRADVLGNSWSALSERRIKVKSRPHRSHGRTITSTTPRLINRDSGKLYRAFAPGRVTTSYVPGSDDQEFVLTYGGMTIGVSLPYAEYVNMRRELIPDRIEPWLRDAVEFALGKIERDLKALARRK